MVWGKSPPLTLHVELAKIAKLSNIESGLPVLIRGLPAVAILAGAALAKATDGRNRIEERVLGNINVWHWVHRRRIWRRRDYKQHQQQQRQCHGRICIYMCRAMLVWEAMEQRRYARCATAAVASMQSNHEDDRMHRACCHILQG